MDKKLETEAKEDIEPYYFYRGPKSLNWCVLTAWPNTHHHPVVPGNICHLLQMKMSSI